MYFVLYGTHRCSHAQFIVKTDDDIYFNVPKLYLLLTSAKFPKEHYGLAGRLIRHGRVVKNPTQKWYTPEYMFNEDYYPNYLAGCGYLMSNKVAHTLYNVSLQMPLLHHEDVFITGICARAAGITPHHLMGMTNYFADVDICNSWYIVVHRFTPEKLLRLWKPIAQNKCNVTAATNSLRLISAATSVLFSSR
uniref:Hexosyltransferase n=1 Tax=Cacopsylla melanoneura TaxID=428564 RepID=A0A8D8LQD3_9HEMI